MNNSFDIKRASEQGIIRGISNRISSSCPYYNGASAAVAAAAAPAFACTQL